MNKLILLQFMTFSVILADPIVIATWNYERAVAAAWAELVNGKTPIDAVEAGCLLCENEQCRGSVGWGGKPDENGETTLDAMLMDGTTLNVGAVGGLRRIKNPVSVARRVLDNTEHSFLVGDQATEFAKAMGFVEEDLSSINSTQQWQQWKTDNCQPNFRVNVLPDPTTSCGPYNPVFNKANVGSGQKFAGLEENHDTIGIIAIDQSNTVAAGTSTNGLKFKIPGRVGDSPIPGAGSYADSTVGAAAATGNGDLFLRILPSLIAVEEMRRGVTPTQAAETALSRVIQYYPNVNGGIIAANIQGEYGAACAGYAQFPYTVQTSQVTQPTVNYISCLTPPPTQ